jgi:ribosomal protein L29
MKKKEKASLQTMKTAELAKVISEAKLALMSMKVNRQAKPSKNVHESTKLRRKIAIASTIAHLKELKHE